MTAKQEIVIWICMHRYKQTNHNEPYQGYTKGKNLAEMDDNKKMEDEISETVGEILSKKLQKRG